jgi:transcriptional regulator with PAS, ATPase and Fis domain
MLGIRIHRRLDVRNAPPPVSLSARSEVMQAVLSRLDTIAASDSSVLLIGETGVGKELIAEYLHRTSPRHAQPFVKVGLSALPPELLESELFGHDRGAYTSAASDKKGLFELANTGSIFLDDIDDFPVPLQSKLLRVLESHEVMHVGGTTPIPIDVRLITATKVDLRTLVEKGHFRSDLYYRINVVPIVIPPLRERREDVQPLVEHFLRRYAAGREITVSPAAMGAFAQYAWPGNVRELRNLVQRMALFASTRIDVQDLPVELRDERPLNLIVKACSRCFTEENMTFDQIVACLESNLLRRALQEAGGNRSKAAQVLKMSASTFRDKLKKYGISDPE